MTPQLRMGWTGSILLHLLLLLLAILMRIPDVVRTLQFVEMDWGAVAAPAKVAITSPAPKQPTTTTRSATTVSKKAVTSPPASRRIVLPLRTLPDPSQELLSVPQRADKVEVAGPDRTPEKVDRSPIERSDPIGSREQLVSGRDAGTEGTGAPTSAAGGGVSRPGVEGSGSGVGYNVQWSGGGSRQRLSGNLPKYPPGTNVQAQVRIQAHVMPDGTVRMVQPVQKANQALEDAAMKELRLWKFDPLPGTVPQIAQTCVVTFMFKLR